MRYDELMERCIIAENDLREATARGMEEDARALAALSNIEMSEVVSPSAEWVKGSPRMPGRYVVEFEAGDVATVYKYTWGDAVGYYEHNGEACKRLVAFHYLVPARTVD